MTDPKTKKCSKCGRRKLLNEFYRGKNYKTGYHSECKLCSREYYKKNRKRIREYQSRYYKKNKQKIIIRVEDWRKSNPEKARKNARRSEHNYRKTPKGIYHNLVWSSKKRGMPIEISQEDFLQWYSEQEKVCVYCEINKNNARKITGKRLTIDRLDNKLPYSLGNIALACDWCNGVKSSILTKEEMFIVGKRIIKPKWKKLL